MTGAWNDAETRWECERFDSGTGLFCKFATGPGRGLVITLGVDAAELDAESPWAM